jgi:hypothetical protein
MVAAVALVLSKHTWMSLFKSPASLAGEVEAVAVPPVVEGAPGAHAVRESSVAAARATIAEQRQYVFTFMMSP